MTTFWPPSPVRTKARSLDERRYSQFISHTMIATTMATAISPRIDRAELCSCHDRLLLSQRRMRLNFRVVSVSATSVGSRSMLEAP